MIPRFARASIALVTLLLASRFAAAAGPRLTHDDRLGAEWDAPLRTLEVHLAERTDLDATATVEVLGAGREALVHVTLGDGRSTVRRLRDPAELEPALLALLLLLPERRTGPATSASTAPPSVTPPPRVRVELGMAPSTHLTPRPVYLGYGFSAFAQLAFDAWTLGIASRWDIDDVALSRDLPAGFNMQSVRIAALVGRRFSGAGVTFDLAAGPELGVENQEASPEGSGPEGIGGTYADGDVTLVGRLSTAGVPWAPFASVAGEVFPTRLRADRRIDPGLPILPAFGLGLAVGVLWRGPE